MAEYMIAGLGNPGREHAGQRHNVGACVINRLARRESIDLKAGRTATTGRGVIEGKPVLLVRPRTFMNQSGEAIGPLLRREKLQIERLIVIYDELDLDIGWIRMRQKGGPGGHNGMRSIISAAGSSDFGRIRVGIGRPKDLGVPSWDPEIVMDHVLSDPPPESRRILEESVNRTCEAIAAILRVGWERAMDVYNRAPDAVAQADVSPATAPVTETTQDQCVAER